MCVRTAATDHSIGKRKTSKYKWLAEDYLITLFVPLQLENIHAKYADIKTAVQNIEKEVNSQEQNLNEIQKIVTDFEHHERLCGCGDMTMDDRMQWLPGQQAELLKLLMQVDEQFKYFSAQTKEMANFMRVCRARSEAYSVIAAKLNAHVETLQQTNCNLNSLMDKSMQV